MPDVKVGSTLSIEERYGQAMFAFRRSTTAMPLLAGLALGLAAILVLQACARDGSASAAAAAATPEEAIAQLVQSSGDHYAGLCEQTSSPEDIGKVCSRPIESRGDLHAHLIGRTFSEFSTWVFLEHQSDGWTVVETEPLDFHDLTGTIPWPR
jgi:hypothetical protein